MNEIYLLRKTSFIIKLDVHRLSYFSNISPTRVSNNNYTIYNLPTNVSCSNFIYKYLR